MLWLQGSTFILPLHGVGHQGPLAGLNAKEPVGSCSTVRSMRCKVGSLSDTTEGA